MLDRVGLIAPRLAALPPDDAEWTADLLAEVRVGINLVELRRVRRSFRTKPGLKSIISWLPWPDISPPAPATPRQNYWRP
jgi:hypothetical protein